MDDLFFQGDPCIHGHSGIRYRSNRNCVECKKTSHTRHVFATYKKTEDYKAARRCYNLTPAGKEVCRRNNIKQRCRRLGRVYEEHETPLPPDGLCPYCKIKMGSGKTLSTLDHTLSLNSGGHHISSNTKWICISCNKRKGDRPLAVFLEKLREEACASC